jgi:hypothetical protein
MINKKLIQLLLIFILISVGLMFYSQSNFSSASAQSRTPPKINFPRPRGTPSAKNATGSRGVCPTIFSLGGNPGYTLTVSESPTFWFYIPHGADKISNIEFELQYKNVDTIETVKVTLSPNSSLIPIRLSKPLPVNQKLFWYLKFECQSSLDFGQDFIKGFIERILVTHELNQQLNIAQTPFARISIYAKNGIWYDTLTELLTQPDLQEIRTDFFKEVGLGEIANVPLNSID